MDKVKTSLIEAEKGSQLFEIEFANQKALDELVMLPTAIRAKCFYLLERMKVDGPNLGEPFTKKIAGTGSLFEIRAKALEGIGRCIYCVCVQKRIVILHYFVKKTQKTPAKNLEIALKRYKEFINDNY